MRGKGDSRNVSAAEEADSDSVNKLREFRVCVCVCVFVCCVCVCVGTGLLVWANYENAIDYPQVIWRRSRL